MESFTIAKTASIGGIAFPSVNDNIKRFGVIKALDVATRGEPALVFTVFHALNGSATLLPDVADQYKDSLFVMFAFNVDGDTIRKYANTFKIPNNFVIYGVCHQRKGNRKNYNRLLIVGYGLGMQDRTCISCESSKTDYALGIEMRNDALYRFATSRYTKNVNVRFGYAFDNGLFRLSMIEWFVERFTNVDFTGIKYVAAVAGSGMTSYLLAKALSILGVTGISLILVSVGADLTVDHHNTLYPTQVIKAPIRYLESFDFATLPDGIRGQLADVGITRADYDGKVFYPFYYHNRDNIHHNRDNIHHDCDYNWSNTLFLLVRNGY